MNRFAGNITLNGNKVVPQEFDYEFIESLSKIGDKNLYIFGETNFKSSKDLVQYLENTFGKLKDFDISISTENKIVLMDYDYEEGIYELASFEGEFTDFNEIKERFLDHEAIFSIREANISNKFGNKIIKC
ncbi:hypothetical protein LRZ95_01645, partial [Candidatus Gracilibacteria bacterium]|nr:hypothetical protein [Candidatus Gracilibacteria bacterium]